MGACTDSAMPASRATSPSRSAHDLDAERHRAILAHEALAKLAELLDDRVNRVLARSTEEEARVEHDDLCARSLRDPGRVIEHSDSHVQLLAALGVTHEAGDWRMHGQCNVMLPGKLSELLRKLVVHPEAALEVDLAGGQLPLEQRGDRRLGGFTGRHAGRAEMQVTRH